MLTPTATTNKTRTTRTTRMISFFISRIAYWVCCDNQSAPDFAKTIREPGGFVKSVIRRAIPFSMNQVGRDSRRALISTHWRSGLDGSLAPPFMVPTRDFEIVEAPHEPPPHTVPLPIRGGSGCPKGG